MRDNMKQLSTHAATAKAIRAELKQAFPTIQFFIKSRSFSMGNAVDINWVNGPNYDLVNEIVRKYEYGHFNGMEDIYENSNSRDDIPQVKYVHIRRELGIDVLSSIFEFLKKTHSGFENISDINQSSQDLFSRWRHWTAREFINWHTRDKDLTNGWNYIL